MLNSIKPLSSIVTKLALNAKSLYSVDGKSLLETDLPHCWQKTRIQNRFLQQLGSVISKGPRFLHWVFKEIKKGKGELRSFSP